MKSVNAEYHLSCHKCAEKCKCKLKPPKKSVKFKEILPSEMLSKRHIAIDFNGPGGQLLLFKYSKKEL